MNSTIIARKSERGRRPQWILRTLLLEAGVPWSEVRAMAPIEALQRVREMRAEAPKVRVA